ncbi:oligosaccharyl transferase subunit ost3/OST6 [Xylographa bjoerkii]|nr:oligosaccharyl transferase subunit ost3/OST6 [Xylographa bjoerkii]
MKILSILSLALLPLSALAAKKTPGGKFWNFQSKALQSSPVKLNDASYEELTTAPRDYSAVVLLTAVEAHFGCQLCREFQPEWNIVGKSWTKGDRQGATRTLFGTLDFADGKNTFQKLMLQTAPVILLFPPTTGHGAKADAQPIRYDFTTGPQTAEQIYPWIARHLPEGPQPPIYRPFNYLRLIAVTTILLGVISFLSIAAPYLLPLIQNRNLWAAISLIIILLFTSGHMFNHIRKVPYVTPDGKGGVQYFVGGFSNQLGLETQIIAAMYGILSFATIALAVKVPRMTSSSQQQVMVFVWGAVMFGMYGFLMRVFKIKNGGYPFRLPPF